MKHKNKITVIAFALVATFFFSPSISIAAKSERKQCDLDERWDKELKRCVVQGGS